MEQEPKIKVQESNFWLEAKAEGSTLKFTLLIMSQAKEVVKVSRILDIQKEKRELMQFESGGEVIKMMKEPDNYLLDLQNYSITLKWNVQAGHYKKNVNCGISLFPENTTKLEKLELQNQFLRQRLRKYETDPNEDSLSLSPQISQDYPVIPNTESITSEDHGRNQVFENKNPINQYRQQESNIIEIGGIEEDESQKGEDSTKKKQIPKNTPKKKQIRKQTTKQIHTRKAKQKIFQNIEENQEQKIPNAEKNPQKEEQKTKRRKRGKKRNQRKGGIIEGNNENKEVGRVKIGNKHRIEYSNGDYYFGELKDDQYHGQGLYSSKTEGKYEGTWVNGLSEGPGKSQDLDGNRHEGMYAQNMKQGWGIDIYSNGEKYQGYFEKDCKQGLGKYWYENGDTFEGEWKRDMCDGLGLETYQDGSFFSGRWVNDEKEGEGIFTQKTGQRTKQLWAKGAMISEQQLE